MNHRYLDGRVANASQAELQLMLLDGALRFGRQAQQLWLGNGSTAEADQLLARSTAVVEELIHSVSLGRQPESKRLEEEYAFIFRQLTAAHVRQDAAQLDAALKLLAFHRETWRLACENLKIAAAPAPSLDSGVAPTGGFSLQA